MQPALQYVGALAGFVGIEPGVRPAGLLLQLQLFGAVVPVSDLLGQPVLHGRFGFADQFELGFAYVRQVLRHDVGNGVALCLLLQFTVDPLAFRPAEQGLAIRLACGQWAIVEIGGVVNVAGFTVCTHLDIQHAPGNDTAFAGAGKPGVLNGMFQIEQHAR